MKSLSFKLHYFGYFVLQILVLNDIIVSYIEFGSYKFKDN